MHDLRRPCSLYVKSLCVDRGMACMDHPLMGLLPAAPDIFLPPHAIISCAVSRIALVKPDKARSIENMILSAAQRGALGEKVRGGAGSNASPV